MKAPLVSHVDSNPHLGLCIPDTCPRPCPFVSLAFLPPSPGGNTAFSSLQAELCPQMCLVLAQYLRGTACGDGSIERLLRFSEVTGCGCHKGGMKTHQGRPCGDTGSRRPSARQGGRPQEEPALRPLDLQPPAPGLWGAQVCGLGSGTAVVESRLPQPSSRGRWLIPGFSG